MQRSIPLSTCSLGLFQSVQPAPDFGNRLRGGNYCSRRQCSRRVASRGPGLWHTFSHQLPPASVAPVEFRYAFGVKCYAPRLCFTRAAKYSLGSGSRYLRSGLYSYLISRLSQNQTRRLDSYRRWQWRLQCDACTNCQAHCRTTGEARSNVLRCECRNVEITRC